MDVLQLTQDALVQLQVKRIFRTSPIQKTIRAKGAGSITESMWLQLNKLHMLAKQLPLLSITEAGPAIEHFSIESLDEFGPPRSS
jgi:hypothetical protein|tara:strand:- start:415 stop:669 length:255 start_codon:yes stop_codon:yes gene_type:complete